MEDKPEWYVIDADWDDSGYASIMLMHLGESHEWLELVSEASECTHATSDEVWEGMAAAIRGYLEGLE